jgi:hypothetical protein
MVTSLWQERQSVCARRAGEAASSRITQVARRVLRRTHPVATAGSLGFRFAESHRDPAVTREKKESPCGVPVTDLLGVERG